MNSPDHISESLETIFCVKILKFFDIDPGSGMEKILIRDLGWKKLGSGIPYNIPDPQHCLKDSCFSSTGTGNKPSYFITMKELSSVGSVDLAR
jgi:hypothetical protein